MGVEANCIGYTLQYKSLGKSHKEEHELDNLWLKGLCLAGTMRYLESSVFVHERRLEIIGCNRLHEQLGYAINASLAHCCRTLCIKPILFSIYLSLSIFCWIFSARNTRILCVRSYRHVKESLARKNCAAQVFFRSSDKLSTQKAAKAFRWAQYADCSWWILCTLYRNIWIIFSVFCKL